MNLPLTIEVLTIFALTLIIIVCILLIIVLIRGLSAIKKVDNFFSYFNRIRGILESFEWIPVAIIGIAKDFLFELIGKKNNDFDKNTIMVKKWKK